MMKMKGVITYCILMTICIGCANDAIRSGAQGKEILSPRPAPKTFLEYAQSGDLYGTNEDTIGIQPLPPNIYKSALELRKTSREEYEFLVTLILLRYHLHYMSDIGQDYTIADVEDWEPGTQRIPQKDCNDRLFLVREFASFSGCHGNESEGGLYSGAVFYYFMKRFSSGGQNTNGVASTIIRPDATVLKSSGHSATPDGSKSSKPYGKKTPPHGSKSL